MEELIEVHAYHGWGFDALFWASLKEKMPDNILIKAADRGYFGGTFQPEYSETSTKKILFLHSYGLHWCPREEFEQADHIVVFNGFPTFHPKEWSSKNRSKKILRAMISQFRKEPGQVLTSFYKNCSYPEKPSAKNLNWVNNSRLLADLVQMNKSKFKVPQTKAQWILIDSEKDRIIPGMRGSELNELLPESMYKTFETAGHGLPLLNPADCWSYLCEVIPIFEEYENS